MMKKENQKVNEDKTEDSKTDLKLEPKEIVSEIVGETADLKKKSSEKEEPESFEKENILLKNKLLEYEDLIKRQQAEFDNFRKRSCREKEDFFQHAQFEILKEILEVVDNFQRALESGKKDNKLGSYLQGFEMIYEQIKTFFNSKGIKEIGEEGDEFDPKFHKAIQLEESKEDKVDRVSEVYQKGYLLGDKILRIATVKVKKGLNLETTHDKSHGTTHDKSHDCFQKENKTNS